MRTETNLTIHTSGRRHSRQGVTLLFVVSMIVLFLLMGTAFLILANDYYRASRPRSTRHIFEADNQALVQMAFYELIRGPELSNPASPLRGQDILSDMYGYGFKARVIGTPIVAPIPGTLKSTSTTRNATDHFVELQLVHPTSGDPAQFENLLTGGADTIVPRTGQFSGRVISFVTGRAKGISTRIVDHRIVGAAHRFIISLPSRIDRGSFALADLADEIVIINGRAFGGVGCGAYNQGAVATTAAFTEQALRPNRVGESLAQLTGGGTSAGYLSFQVPGGGFSGAGNLAGPNESYDGPDYQNMYLSGFDNSPVPNLIPSFHRPSLNASRPTDLGTKFSAFERLTDTFQLEVDTDLDGELDAFWMDIGLPIQTSPDGLRYKPLVAYRVVDQDGLVNLNVAGSSADLANLIANPAAPAVRGQGYGPAELAVATGANPILNNLEYQNILWGTAALPGRYGVDQVPGAVGRDGWSLEKLFGYPVAATATTGGFFASSSHNIHGRFPVNYPTDRVAAGQPVPYPNVDLNDALFNNALPELDFTVLNPASGTLVNTYNPTFDSMNNSPYEANFAPNYLRGWEPDDDDELFTPSELESLLRPSDVDSNLLPRRLINLTGGPTGLVSRTAARESVTTESYEVPMSPAFVHSGTGTLQGLNSLLRSRLNGSGIATLANNTVGQDDLVRDYLSHELIMGMKMDINRVFGQGLDDNANGVVDEPASDDDVDGTLEGGEANTLDLTNDSLVDNEDRLLARYKFAKQLYILMLLTTEDSALDFADIFAYRTAVAQWCINVVDFRDPDSIHSPFEFDLNPWDGWTPNGNIADDEGGDRAVVWGAERPELLLTESFASHDRRTEDLSIGGETTDAMDDDFDSRLVPHTSVFLEIYHPWTQGGDNQIFPAELGTGGVNLQATSPNGNDPVWRIGFKPRGMAGTAAQIDPPFDRTVVFSNVTPPAGAGFGEMFSTTQNIPVVAPGRYAVIGSAGNVGNGRTVFGRTQTGGDAFDPNMVQSITLDTAANEIQTTTWDGTNFVDSSSSGIPIIIDQPRSLSVSDPTGGYPAANGVAAVPIADGPFYDPVRDTPVDAGGDDAIRLNGTTDNFRIVELQRLANPLKDWDAQTNPYLTIDKLGLDLVAFNGLENAPNNNSTAEPGVTSVNTDFGSLERGESQDADAKLLFRRDFGNPGGNGAPLGGPHMLNFGFDFDQTFGRANSDYFTSPNNFGWLTWNNRPYVSHLELMNVPASAPEDLTADFSRLLDDSADDKDPYGDPLYAPDAEAETPVDPTTPPPAVVGGNTMRSKFGHLLNFYGHDETATPMLGNFYRLLDFVEVPSRYVGTEQWLDQATFNNGPFNFVSHFRYPGKININTIPNQRVFDALMGGFATDLTFAQFNASRWRGAGTSFFRPYRNSTEGNLVATGIAPDLNVDCGLLRRGATGTPPVPLFETDSPDGYFQNAMRQRLGNMVTTRSSVFAIWITVGYFEVEANDELRTDGSGPSVGVEVGRDTGGAIRNRGFYLFDRSIPVAYEPGKNHNIERAILVQSIIE